jgi:hypothetical protein
MTAPKAAPSSPANGKAAHVSQTPKRRVTFAIDEQVDNILEVYCNSTRQQKNSVAEQAIAEHLARRRKEVQDAVKKTEAALNHLPSR